MQYRQLGTTDLRVSEITLGTMTFGEQNTEAEGHEQMDRALDAGINILDAAELYPIAPRRETQGRTEEIIGTWMKARRNRDRVVIATKVIGRSTMDWFRDDGARGELSRPQILEAVDKNLRRLQTDYIDLYQVHWPDRAVPTFGSNPTVYKVEPAPEIAIEETLDVLGELVKSGKVRHVGISNESPWGTMRYLRHHERSGAPRIQSIQNAYNLVNRTFEVGLAEFCTRETVSLLAYSPLGQGFLTGKYRNGARPAGARKTLFDRLQRYEKPGTDAAVEKYCALAAELGVSPSVLAIAFVLSRPFVTSTIIGATSMAQLEEDLSALDFAITPEIEERIDAIHQIHSNPAP
ncbi:MAG TPA: aldo/keto reductase [Kaistiaceae bacterium]|nr:aldo/keto reductase [Kaistiaceae bacterium]